MMMMHNITNKLNTLLIGVIKILVFECSGGGETYIGCGF